MTKITKQEYKERINKICSLMKAVNDKTGEYEQVKLYPFQEDIIYEIVTKENPFVHVLVSTRGGKSFCVSMGVLISCMIHDNEE
jgi:hypothetical protein